MSDHQVVSADTIYKAVVKKEDAYSALSRFAEMIESFNVGENNIDILQEYLSLSRNCHEILELVQNLINTSAKDAATLINISTGILVRVANDLKHFSTVGLSFVADILGSGSKTLHNFLKPMQKPARMKMTLHLLSAMVAQGPQAARDVFIKMGFSGNSFSHLFHKSNQTKDGNVRTSYLELIVLFLTIGDNNLVRQILETKGFLNGIFPGLVHDQSSTIILVLQTFLTKIIINPLIGKTSKIRLFNDYTLKFVLNLYDWKGTAVKPQKSLKRKLGNEGEFQILEATEEMISSVHECVHKFLLEVCCSYKNGIVFRDTSCGSSGKNQNHILANILKSLSNPHLHLLKNDFVISVLKTCPDQVKYYLPSLSDSLSPRLSVPWVQAIELLKKIVKAHDYPSILFENGEKIAVTRMVSMAKQMIFPEVINVSQFTKCLKDDHPFVCHNLSSYLCCSLQCVKKIVQYRDSPNKNSLYSSEELKDFYLNFLPVVAKAVPEFTIIQEYWHRLLNLDNFEFDNDVMLVTDDFVVPSLKTQLSQVLEILKIYHEVLPTTKISHDFCLNMFTGLGKLKDEASDTKDYILQLELLDFIAIYNSNEGYINMQNVDFSPVLIALDIYLVVEDIQSRSKVESIILKFVSNIYSLDICDWELKVWLKHLKVGNSARQKSLINFFGEVLRIVAKKDLPLVSIRKEDKKPRCSSLLFAALLHLNRHHDNLGVCVSYVQTILINIMHRQVDSKQFFTSIEKYCHMFSQNIINYWKMISYFEGFSAKGENALNYLLERPVTCGEALQNVFVSANFNLNNASSVALTLFAQLFKEIEGSDEEIETLLWQLLTYIDLEASLIFETSLTDNNINIAFYSSIIEELIRKVDATIADVMVENRKCHMMKTIVQHPVILKCFLFVPNDAIGEQNYEAILPVTRLVLYILSDYFSSDNDGNVEIHLDPFKEKAVVFCETYMASLYCNSTYSVSFWGIAKKLIMKFSSMFSCRNIVALLEHFLAMEDGYFQKLDPKRQVLSTLVDMYCEGGDYFLLSVRCARILLCKYLNGKRKKYAEIIKLLKKHPSYSLALQPDDIDQFITHQESSNLEILDILTFHNVAIRNNVKNFILSISDSFEEGNEEFFLRIVTTVANHISASKKSKSVAFLSSVAESYWKCLCSVIAKNIGQDIAYPITNIGQVISSLDVHHVIDQTKIQQMLQLLLQESKHALPSNSKLGILLEIICCWKNSWPPESLLQIIMNWMNLSFQESSDLDETLLKFFLDSINHLENSVIHEYFEHTGLSHIVQGTLKATFRNDNDKAPILDLLKCICEKIFALKSDKIETKKEIKIVHTFLTSHSNFFAVMLDDNGKNTFLKGSILSLLIVLVKASGDLCKDTHIPLLLASYNGSLSPNDQMILHLLKLYEDAGINMENFSPFMWGNSAVSHYSVNKNVIFYLWKQPRMREILCLFRKDLLYSLVSNFPLDLKLQTEMYEKEESHLQYDKIYDPRFVMHLASTLLFPGAYVHCREFIESGVLGVIFRSLSSEDKDMRALGYYCLSEFYSHLQNARSKQSQIWIALLDSIRYSIEKPNPRIPSIVTLFLAKAVNILIRPDNQLYSAIYKFLTVKPTLDLMQVPEFYKLFNSTDIKYRIQRSWILSLVGEGLQSSLDFHLCQKLYLFTILLPYYSSPISVEAEKIKILYIVLVSVKIFSSARSLCQSGLLTWLYSAIRNSETEETAIINSLNDIMHTLWHISSKNMTIDSHSRVNEGEGNQAGDASTNEQNEETYQREKRMYSSFPSEFLLAHIGLIDKLVSLNDIGLLKYLQTLRDVLNLTYLKSDHMERLFTHTNTPLSFIHVSSLVKHWQRFSEAQHISLEKEDCEENRSIDNFENTCLVHQYFSEILVFWIPPWTHLTFQDQYDAVVSLCLNINYLSLKHLCNNQSCINRFSQWLLKCLNGDSKHGLIDSLCSSSDAKSIYCVHIILGLYETVSSTNTRKQKNVFLQPSVWAEICSLLDCSVYVNHQMSILQSLAE